ECRIGGSSDKLSVGNKAMVFWKGGPDIFYGRAIAAESASRRAAERARRGCEGRESAWTDGAPWARGPCARWTETAAVSRYMPSPGDLCPPVSMGDGCINGWRAYE